MNTAIASSISTQSVPVQHRAEYWRDLICDTFVELDCPRIGDGFFGELSDHTVGSVQLTRVRSAQHEALRTPRQIAKSTEAYFLVSLQISGQGLVQQDGRTAKLNPGDFALYDSTRRYSLNFDDRFEELVLKLPRALVVDRVEAPEALTATCISGHRGLGRLAFEFVRNLAFEIDQMSPEDRSRVANGLVDLLTGAIAAGTNRSCATTANVASQLLRAKLLIGEQLRDETLGKAQIASQLGISTRQLSKLFSSEDCTFSGWLREQRLLRIAEDLRKRELSARSISSVAYAWGMNSMPHFSRVFRAKFDCSPKQYRSNSQSSPNRQAPCRQV